MRHRSAVTLLTVAMVFGLLGCSGSEDDTPPPETSQVPRAPDLETLREQVVAGTVDSTLPDTLVDKVPFVARINSLSALEQSCVRGYLELTRETPCVLGDLDAEREMVLWGDAHAAQWIPALVTIGQEEGWRVRVLTKYGCPALLGVTPWLEAERRAYQECVEANDIALQVINEADPDVVLISGAVQGAVLMVDGRPEPLGTPIAKNGWRPYPKADRRWQVALAATLEELDGQVPRVVVLGDTPYPGHDAQTCLSKNKSRLLACSADAAVAIHAKHNRAEEETARRHSVDYVDTAPWFCAAGSCPAVIGETFVYRDGSQVGRSYALHLSRVLGEAAGLLD